MSSLVTPCFVSARCRCKVSRLLELRLHFSLFFFSQPDIRTLSSIPSAFSSATLRVPASAEVKCIVPTRMVMVVSCDL